jgi:glycosyltransferase involved in cell wall biosynthesis
VGRLVNYKHPEKVVRVFNDMNLPLRMVGTGQLESRLRRLAKPNVLILGEVSPSALVKLMQNCRALIFFHEEDFGIVPLEAQSSGRPVIALNRGGASETVIPGITGELVDDDSPSALKTAIINFDPKKFDPQRIRRHAQSFSRQRFLSEFTKAVSVQWTKYQNTLLS